MRVEDLKNKFGPSFQAGAWIAPTGELLKVDTFHIHDIIQNPAKFGTTREHIDALHAEYNEQVGQEGRAREALIIEALQKGWIRIRAYRNYWSFTVWDLSNKTKQNIEAGVRALVKGGVMDKYAGVKLNVVKTDDLKEFEADDIIAGHLYESEDNEVKHKTAKLVEFKDLPDLPVNLTESGLSRIHSKMEMNHVGAISGFRGERTHAENMAVHRALRAKLVSMGYDVTEVVGSYVENYDTPEANEVKEQSLFVTCRSGQECDNLEADLVALGQKYNQDSILFKPAGESAYLVGTSQTAEWPPFGEKVNVGKPAMGKLAQFMSRVKNRPFVFESVMEVIKPSTRNGLWAMNKIAEG